jgi:hypothetical protein
MNPDYPQAYFSQTNEFKPVADDEEKTGLYFNIQKYDWNDPGLGLTIASDALPGYGYRETHITLMLLFFEITIGIRNENKEIWQGEKP